MKKINLAKRLMGFTLILVILATALSFQISASDYEDNWAKGVIDSFIAQKIIALDANGNVRPSEIITRAETIAVINKAFNFTRTAAVNYTDVSGADSFYADIQIAEAMGYMPNGGNVSEFRPYDALTREEMMIIIARVLELQPRTTLVDIKYDDCANMSAEGRGALGALLEPSVNIAESLGDTSFSPQNGLKRNLAFALVNKAMDYYKDLQSGRKLYSSVNVDTTMGSASDVTKNFNNVTIVGKNAVLENVVVWGNLTIDKNVGSESVTIKNVTVKGNLFIYGGSTVNLIDVNNVVKSLTVNKANNNLTLNISGSSAITEIIVKSGVTIDASSLTPSKITLTNDISKGVKVTVGVNTVKELIVQSAGVNLTINAMTVGELNIARTATGAFVDVTKGSTVSKAVVNAVCDIQGAGTLLAKQVNVNGANVAVSPGRTTTSTSTSARTTTTTPSSTYSSIIYAPAGTYTDRYYNYYYNGRYYDYPYYNSGYPYYAYSDYYAWWFGQYGFYPTYEQYNVYLGSCYPNGFNGYWGGSLVYPYTSHDEYIIWYRSYYGTSSVPTLNDYYNAVYGIYGYYPYNYPNYPNYPTTSAGVTLNQTTASVAVGGAIQLTPSIYPYSTTDAVSSWTSSNIYVAQVSTTGVVTGIGAGTATITVKTVSGHTATCYVTVTGAYTSTGVTLAPVSSTILVGEIIQLYETIYPYSTSDYVWSWTSSNSLVAKVDNYGRVTGVSAGTATITVMTATGKTATCVVTVKPAYVPVTDVVLNISTLPLTGPVNTNYTLTATINPTGATNQTVTWASSNPLVATVSTTGVVTALTSGTTTITVTTVDGGKTDTCAVTVTITP